MTYLPVGLPKPYFEDDAVQIFHADCRDILPHLGPVDLVLTSPPYNCGMPYSEYSDDVPADDFLSLNRTWLRQSREIASEGARLYAVVSDRMMWWFKEEAEAAGWHWAQLLAWCKPNFGGGASRIGGDWNNMTEWILLFRAGKRTPMLNGEGTTHNWFVIPSPQRNWTEEAKEHIAQWPVRLPRKLISRTPGTVVLDPFMGSGSTLRAACDLGRKAIGIEVSLTDCEIAAKRMAQGVLL